MFFNLLKQNLKTSYKDLSKVVVNVIFFLLVTFLLLLLLQDLSQNSINNSVFRVVIWFSILFSVFYQSVNFLKDDYLDGTIEQMLIICGYNLESYIVAKVTVFWLEFCLPIIITSFLLMKIFQFTDVRLFSDLALLVTSTVAICFVSCLCASFNILSKRATLLVILALPLLIPVVIIAIIGNLGILAAISILLSLISLFSCSKIIKIVSQ